MVQFTSLSLSGFKSFADKEYIEIGPGLTGVVGPNGCGKSNLVEALRWVMGENSAKRMRGSGMEDVIFAGTSIRSGKNRAEVTVTLDNRQRTAPDPYNSFDSIEVTRTIERDHGSTYRINGRIVRARDVQMFFSDIVAGSNSPALVSQGKVTMLINAKPTERRQILEESAGISGLYVRRSEAETRLRAAEANLLRIDDILGGLESRYEELQKQIRQANKYKNISQTIRELDLLKLYIEWQAIQQDSKSVRTDFEETESFIRSQIVKVTELTEKQTSLSIDIPALREADSRISAQLQTYLIEKQRFEDELARIDDQIKNADKILIQSLQDQGDEKEHISSLQSALKMREAELVSLTEQGDRKQELDTKKRQCDGIRQNLQKKESELEDMRSQTLQFETALKQAQQNFDTAQARHVKMEEDLRNASDQLKEKKNQAAPAISRKQDLEHAVSEQETLIAHEEEVLSQLEKEKREQDLELSQLERIWNEENTKKEKISSEINVLNDFLKSKNEEEKTAVLSAIKPKKGYEIALAKAMGDTLLAAVEDPEAGRYWQALKHMPADLPELSAMMEPLSSKVKAPEALSICLSQIGVLTGEFPPEQIFQALRPGQMAVSLGGDVYRWDGYVITARSQSATAQHLERKNRLEALEKEQTIVLEKLAALEIRIETEKEKSAKLNAKKSQQESATVSAKEHYKKLQNQLQDFMQQQAESRMELIRMEERIIALQTAVTETDQEVEIAKRALQQAGSFEGCKESQKEMSELRKSEILELRQRLSTLEQDITRISYEQETKKNRVDILTADIKQTRTRIHQAEQKIETLNLRHHDAAAEKEKLANRPDQIREKEQALLSQISELQESRTATSEALQKAEHALSEHNSALKAAEKQLNEAKEKRAGLSAQLQGFTEKQEAVCQRMNQQGFEEPGHLYTALDWPPEKEFPFLQEIEQKYEAALSTREKIGPVNLMAADEAEKAAQDIDTLKQEREDLVQAIQKLRTAIQKLNREARERMVKAFDSVNEKFQTLFQNLFGGGQAHLELTESEDILESGLEIFASPPGKKMQSLGLLSGGEQTLASIALIFAMFLTKPAPICVLDEIDAPLDDSNVDKICTMIEDIARTTQTRFFMITHHRMTMARMNRLYGVTMAERGVSQLVSVDLQQNLFPQTNAEAA